MRKECKIDYNGIVNFKLKGDPTQKIHKCFHYDNLYDHFFLMRMKWMGDISIYIVNIYVCLVTTV